MGRENLADELLSTNTMKLNKALRKQVFSKAALRGIQEPLMTLVVIAGLYLMLVHLKMDLPKVMVLIFLMARMLNETGKVQRKYQEVAICESAYWSLQGKSIRPNSTKSRREVDSRPPWNAGSVIDQVDFGYGEQMILKNVCLDIPAGHSPLSLVLQVRQNNPG